MAGSIPVLYSVMTLYSFICLSLVRRPGAYPRLHIAKGGVWIWPILSLGLLAAMIALTKAIAICRVPKPDMEVVTFDMANDRRRCSRYNPRPAHTPIC